MGYRIEFSKEAQKYIRSIPVKHAKHIKEKIIACLMVNPKGMTSHCNIKLIEGSNPKKIPFPYFDDIYAHLYGG